MKLGFWFILLASWQIATSQNIFRDRFSWDFPDASDFEGVDWLVLESMTKRYYITVRKKITTDGVVQQIVDLSISS